MNDGNIAANDELDYTKRVLNYTERKRFILNLLKTNKLNRRNVELIDADYKY